MNNMQQPNSVQQELMLDVIRKLVIRLFIDPEQDIDSLIGSIHICRQTFGGVTYYELWAMTDKGEKQVFSFYEDKANTNNIRLKHHIVDMLSRRSKTCYEEWATDFLDDSDFPITSTEITKAIELLETT